MKKIWDNQNQKYMYTIDETALGKSMKLKKDKGIRMLNWMEWMLITVKLVVGGALIFKELFESDSNPFVYLFGGLLLISAGYLYMQRRQRLSQPYDFESNMLGDLNHAIESARYKAKISYMMLLYWIPISIITLSALYFDGESLIKIGLTGLFFIVIFFAGRWEHYSCHVARKRKLESIKDKLLTD